MNQKELTVNVNSFFDLRYATKDEILAVRFTPVQIEPFRLVQQRFFQYQYLPGFPI